MIVKLVDFHGEIRCLKIGSCVFKDVGNPEGEEVVILKVANLSSSASAQPKPT